MAEGDVAIGIDGPTKAQLLDWAVGTLQEWFKGWTTPELGVGFMQWRLVPTEYTDTGMKFRIEGGYRVPDVEQEYEVFVKIKKVKK